MAIGARALRIAASDAGMTVSAKAYIPNGRAVLTTPRSRTAVATPRRWRGCPGDRHHGAGRHGGQPDPDERDGPRPDGGRGDAHVQERGAEHGAEEDEDQEVGSSHRRRG